MTQSNKEFEEYLKLMHFTHYNYDQSIMNLETKERLRDIILEEKSIYSESISDIDSTLRKLLNNQQMDISELYRNTLDQSFYANCDFILRILSHSFNNIDNMLSQVQLSNQSQTIIKSELFFKAQENVIENLEKDMKIIEILSEGLEITIQEFTNEQFDPIKRALIYDIFHQVGGFVVNFLQNYMNKQHCKFSGEQQKLIFKVICHLYIYLDQNLKHNLKEKFRIISFIYNFIQTTTIYQFYLYQTINYNTFDIDQYKQLKYMYNAFSQCFLQDNKSINELKEIEQLAQDNYVDLFLKILSNICSDTYQSFVNEIFIKLQNEVQNIQDCHYYLLFIVMTVQKYDQYEYIGQFLQIINNKEQQLIDLIQERPHQFYNYFFQIQLYVLEHENSPISKLIDVLNEIYIKQSKKVHLLFELGKTNFYKKQHLKYKKQIEQIITSEFDNQLSILDLYLQENQEIDIKSAISMLEYFTYFYELLNTKQKDLLFDIVTKYVNSEQDAMVIFCKLNIKLLIIFEQLQDQSIFLQLLQIALQNSTKDKTNSHHFLVLMSDLIVYSIDNNYNFKQVLLAIKLITLSCLSDSDNQKRTKTSSKKLNEQKFMTVLFDEQDVRSPELQDGTDMVTYLLFNLRILNEILNKSLCLVLQICKLNDQQIQYLFEIQQEFAFLIYVIYWKLPDRINLKSKSVQECSNQLAYDYYRFSINFCQLIQQSQNLHKYIYKIINSNLLIAYGIEYHRQLTQILFFDIIGNNYQENDLSRLQKHLQSNQCKLQIVYNKYFELAYSILFEIQFENSESSKLFYLTLLDYFVDCSIQTVLTFQEVLPKFIFYLRIERNQNVLQAISTIIVKALLLNSDNQIIKQLFELFSLNQSTFLRNDIENMRLEIDIFEQIENACHRVSLPPYRIPIFNDIQRTQLIKLADDSKNYAKLTLNILDIIYQTLATLKKIAKEKQDKKKLLHFQGCGSYLEIKDLKINTSEFSIYLNLKLFVQLMETQHKGDESLMELMDQSMIQSLDQITIFILKCGKVTITLYLNSQKSFLISYEIDDSIKQLKFNIQQSTNLNDWNEIQVEYKAQQFNLIHNKLKLHCDNQVKLDLFNCDIIDSLIIGQKNDDTIFDDKYQNMSKSFMDCSFIQENSYFTGQVHSIKIVETILQIANNKTSHKQQHTVLQLNLNNLDSHGGLFRQKNNFINSLFMLDCKQTSQKKFFEYDEKIQIGLICESQNVNILDVFSFFEVFIQNNGINLFYLSIDILSLVTQSIQSQQTPIMDCLILVIKNISMYLSIDKHISKQFQLNGQDLFQYQISNWINQCQCFPNQLFQALLEVYYQDNGVYVLKSIVKIMDSPYVPEEYAQELEKIYSSRINTKETIYDFFQNLSVFCSVRKSLSYLSMQLGNFILQDCNFKIVAQEYFFSHSFQINPPEIQKNQIQVVYSNKWNQTDNLKKIRQLVESISNSCISLTTFDVLQILQINFEFISQKKIQELKSELKNNTQSNNLCNELQQILTNLLSLIPRYKLTFKLPGNIIQLQNQFYDYFFGLLSEIIIRINQLLYDLNGNPIQMSNLFDPIRESQVPIGPSMIKVLMMAFNTKQQDKQTQELQKQIINLINYLYKHQLISDKLKLEVMEFFTQHFKQALRSDQIDNQQITIILDHPQFNQLVQNLIPSQTYEIDQNQKINNFKNKSYELFTYILTYQMEQSLVSPQKLYNLHFPILNKETFQVFLEITHTQIMQLLANTTPQKQKISDEEAQQIKNIITCLLHIEICTHSLNSNVNLNILQQFRVDFFWKIIDKSMIFFDDLQILKCRNVEECIVSVSSKLLNEKLEKGQESIIWQMIEKQEQKLQIPNGGIERIFIQLISKFITQNGSAQILENYINLTDKLHNDNQLNIQKQNTKKLNLFCGIIQDRLQKAIQNLYGSNNQPYYQQFPHLIVYQLLVGLEDCDEITQNQQENMDKVIQLLETTKKYKEIDRFIERFQNYCLENSLDFQQFNDQKQLLDGYNQYIKQQQALNRDQKRQKQNSIKLPKVQAILQNPKQYSDEANVVKQILHQYVFTPFEVVHQIWIYQQQNNKTENSPGMQGQQSVQSQISQRTNSTTSEIKPVTINKMEETWGKISFELKLKNALFYFLDESISTLYDEFNKFLSTEEFNLEKLDQIQNKYQVLGLEDYIRRKQQLQQIKLKNTSKPYIKSNQKVQASSKKTINQDSSNEKSPLLGSKQSPLQDSQMLYDDELSLSMSISTLAKQRNSMKCIGNLIQPELIQPSFSGVRKGSEDLLSDDMTVKGFPCEFITQEGAIFGDLQLVCVKKINFLKFKSSPQSKPNSSKFLIGSVEMMAESKQMTLLVETAKIEYIITRRYILSEVAIEVFFQRQNYFFNLFEEKQRNDFIQKIKILKIGCITDRVEEFNKRKYTQKWQNGQISNFEYLMQINTFSGRTYNDLNQYFIFPWVLKEFNCLKLDLTKQSNFRNLSLPVGAQDQDRLIAIKQRFDQRNPSCDDEYMMYGSHYSNSTIVFNYLLRLEPFNDLHYSLQKNKFDVADRLFSSIEVMWTNSRNQDSKELIPEFYYMPEFLQNINKFDFGCMQSKMQVSDVILPRWVKTKTAEEFVYIMREALECDNVSQNLQNWIDLIFGYLNKGKNAEKANNLFHYLTYEETLRDKISRKDPYLQSYIQQIYFYGQIPFQIFKEAHVQKKQNLNMYLNYKPVLGCKKLLYQNTGHGQIISFYPFDKFNVYIIYSNFTCIQLYQETLFTFALVDESQYQIKQTTPLGDIITTHCNQQNLFTFIYAEGHQFYDKVDSQNHSVLQDTKPYLYLAVGGYQDNSFKIIGVSSKTKYDKPVMVMGDFKKKVSCLKYHSSKGMLVVGSLDNTVSFYKIQFKKNQEVEQIDPKFFTIVQHRSPISCVDISDLYVLSVDCSHVAYVHTTEGEQLHHLILTNDFQISQCIIHPAQFFIFKTKKSQLHVYTFNGNPYLTNFDLTMEPSQNIVFLAPFSSHFMIFSNTEKYLMCYDLFELKLIQQSYTSQLSPVKINLDILEYWQSQNSKKIKQSQPIQGGVTSFHTVLQTEYLDNATQYDNFFFLTSLDSSLYWLRDSKDRQKILRHHLQNTAGLGKNQYD